MIRAELLSDKDVFMWFIQRLEAPNVYSRHARGSAPLCQGVAVNRKRTDPAVSEGEEEGLHRPAGFHCCPPTPTPQGQRTRAALFIYFSVFSQHSSGFCF